MEGSASTSNGGHVVGAHGPMTPERIPRYDTGWLSSFRVIQT